MNGAHAYVHNRKFYLNALENSFEPIYYDGMIKLDKEIDLNHSWLDFNKAFSETYNFKIGKNINNALFHDQIKNQFKKRVIKFDEGKNLYIENSLIHLSNNIAKLDKHLKNIESTTFLRKDMDYVFSDYENN